MKAIRNRTTIPLSKDEKKLYREELFNRLKEWLSLEKGGAMVSETEMILSVAHLICKIQ